MWIRNKRQKAWIRVAKKVRARAPAAALVLFAVLLSASLVLPSLPPERRVLTEKAVEISAVPAQAAAPQTAAAPPDIGISVGDQLTVLDDATLQAWLRDFRALGITWIRFDVNWHSVQYRGRNNYNWQKLDRVMAAVNRAGLKSHALVAYTPPWARSSECKESLRCPPEDVYAFANFVGRAVERYAPQGLRTWEIWNEPNSVRYWPTGVNAAQYARLLKAASVAARQKDKNITLLVGGLGGSSTMQPNEGLTASVTFLEQLYRFGAKNYFDGVAIHPYSYPLLPSVAAPYSWEEINHKTPSLRSIMQANGDGNKRLWVTEFGAPTQGPGKTAQRGVQAELGYDHVQEDLQSRLLQDAIASHRAQQWAGPFFWYSYKDDGTAKHNTENFFGLLRADGSRKPAYNALKQLIQANSEP